MACLYTKDIQGNHVIGSVRTWMGLVLLVKSRSQVGGASSALGRVLPCDARAEWYVILLVVS